MFRENAEAHRKAEGLSSSKSINRILADDRQRELFERYLNMFRKDEDQRMVQSIYERYQKYHEAEDKADKGFTEMQNKFLKDVLSEFHERIGLSIRARRVLTDGNIRDLGVRLGHKLPGANSEQLEDYLRHMAIARPDAVERILELKKEIDVENKSLARIAGETVVDLAKDQGSLWAGMLGAVLGTATGIHVESHGTDPKPKEEKKKEKPAFDLGGKSTEYTDAEAERYRDPRELYDAVERLLKDNNRKEAWRLVENFLPLHIENGSVRKPTYEKLKSLIVKQENNSAAIVEALKLLREKLGLPSEEEPVAAQ